MHRPSKEGILSAALVTLALLAVLWPLGAIEWFANHEHFRYQLRLDALATNLLSQGAHPRWLPEGAGGYGKPYFNFYAPGFEYLCLPFLWLGLTGAVKAGIVLVTTIAAWSAFALGKDWGGHRGGCVAALLVIASPYPMFNLYARCDLAEYAANHLAVAMLLVLWRLLGRGMPLRGALAAGALYALIVIQHNISAMVLTVVFAAFAGGLGLLARLDRGAWLRLAVVFATGLALSAWFWLPSLVELPGVHTDVLTSGMYAPADNLHFDSEAFWNWSRGFATLGPLTVAVFALLCLAARLNLVPRGRVLLLVGGVAALVLLTQPVSRVFWRYFPLASYIQFPWRLFGTATLLCAVAAAHLFRLKPHPGLARLERIGPAAGWYVTVALVFTLAAVWCVSLRKLWTVHVHEPALHMAYWDDRRNNSVPGGYMLTLGEFVPRTADVAATPEFHGKWCVGQGVEVRQSSRDGATLIAEVDATKPGFVEFRQFHFPCWRAEVDGEQAQCVAGRGGCVQVPVDSGARQVRIYVTRTPIQAASEWLSFMALIAAGGVAGLVTWRARQARAGAGS